jgi:hypothetical protein
MHRINHPPFRNKINLTDSAQVWAWARRLGVSADELKAVVEKVANSIAAVTKEIELHEVSCQASPEPTQRKPVAPRAADPKTARRTLGSGFLMGLSVVLELRHRLQLILGGVEDRVIRIPFFVRRPIGAIGFANRGFVGRRGR